MTARDQRFNRARWLYCHSGGTIWTDMIKDRPAHLLADKDYTTCPKLPYRLDWGPVPDLIQRSIADLGGVQPITGAMVKAAGGTLKDKPSAGELAFFREQGFEFQMVSVVVNLIRTGVDDGIVRGTPFAITLIPAQKRGAVTLCPVESVEKLDLTRITQETDPVYKGYDPFTGDWGMYGLGAPGLIGGNGFLDEVGLVIDAFYLATTFDPEDVLAPDIGLPKGKAFEKYAKRRRDLLFRPFKKPEARRIWGAESPIELFLLQELARHGHHPAIQMLILADGGLFPSWYHLWQDMEFRHSPDLVTEADLFFPEQRVAVFCDGAHHLRRKQRERDDAINEKLRELSITSVRISGREIVHDLAAAGQKVLQAISSS
jgi:hypothetical protein